MASVTAARRPKIAGQHHVAAGRPQEYRERSEHVGLEQVGPLLAWGRATAGFDNDDNLGIAIAQIGAPPLAPLQHMV
jgi:hypothetical protein